MQVSDPDVHVQVSPPFADVVESVAVTVYPVIELPPSVSGADQVTTALASPPVALAPWGASGVVAGVTTPDGEDDAPEPSPFDAVTKNVYRSPFVSPLTVQPSGPEVQLHVSPPLPAVVWSVAVTW